MARRALLLAVLAVPLAPFRPPSSADRLLEGIRQLILETKQLTVALQRYGEQLKADGIDPSRGGIDRLCLVKSWYAKRSPDAQ